jgi:histidinol-phosphate aminotransferase
MGHLAIKAISSFFNFKESEVSVGNGADEILDLIMKVFAKKTSKVLLVNPSFSMYDFYTQLHGCKKTTVLLKQNFELDVDRIFKKIDKHTSLILLCSPNNPTSNQFKKGDIKKILDDFKGIVIIDEAYVDFAKYSVINWIRDFDNLIVIRTFSKAFGLAGLRFGFLVSQKSIVEYFTKVTSPFNVNIITQRFITLALKNWEYFKKRLKYVIKERNWLIDNLKKIEGIETYPSDANFILLKVTKKNFSSSLVTERLREKKVLVKDMGKLPLLVNCIRVTVGTNDMNKFFLTALKSVLEE